MRSALVATVALLTITAAPPQEVPNLQAHFGPRERLADAVAREIAQAPRDQTLRLAMFTLSSQAAIDALVARARDVRLIVDHGQHQTMPAMHDAVRRLQEAGAQVRFFCPRGPRCAAIPEPHPEPRTLFHHKFCTIGEAVLITGSANWTTQALGAGEAGAHHENLLILRADSEPQLRAVIRAYVEEFDRLWNSRDLLRPALVGRD